MKAINPITEHVPGHSLVTGDMLLMSNDKVEIVDRVEDNLLFLLGGSAITNINERIALIVKRGSQVLIQL